LLALFNRAGDVEYDVYYVYNVYTHKYIYMCVRFYRWRACDVYDVYNVYVYTHTYIRFYRWRA
jgi:hypothetical protein